MTEDEIKAWFFKYGQYANGRDMALIRAIAEAIAPPRQWVGLTDEEICEAVGDPIDSVYLADFRKVEAKLKQNNGYAEEKNND
jgi:hypothetical protein